MSTPKETYYGEQAYNSQQPRTLPPADPEQQGWMSRQLRKRPLTTRGVHCGEHLAVVPAELDALFGQPWPKNVPHWRSHERVPWESLGNPAVALRVVNELTFLASLLTASLAVSLAIYHGFPETFIEGGGASSWAPSSASTCWVACWCTSTCCRIGASGSIAGPGW